MVKAFKILLKKNLNVQKLVNQNEIWKSVEINVSNHFRDLCNNIAKIIYQEYQET